MKIYVVMAQRKCAYQGQYGLEALACMSEYEYSENPDFLHDCRAEHQGSGEFDAVEIVALSAPEAEIERRLYPDTTAVEATVEDSA